MNTNKTVRNNQDQMVPRPEDEISETDMDTTISEEELSYPVWEKERYSDLKNQTRLLEQKLERLWLLIGYMVTKRNDKTSSTDKT